MSGGKELSQERLEVLKTLCLWYKEEVFRRREQMMWLTGSASGVLVLVLVLLLIVPTAAAPEWTATVLTGTGIAVFFGIVAYLILQQRSRHRMAKHVLIEIERELGLYEEGRYQPDAAFYPEEWQIAWREDWSVPIYLTVVAVLAGLVIAAVLLR